MTPPPEVQLRPYQVDAVERIRRQFEQVRSTLVVMATGTGKTTVFSEVIGGTQGRTLVLAHRDELIQQAAARIRLQTGRKVSIEKAQEYAHRSADVVVASVQSLREERLARFGKSEFSLVVADEAHHYVAPSFRRILDYFEGAKVLGVTATPDRADERAMGNVFDEVAYVYELDQAIADGYLCPVRAVQVTCHGLDLADVKTVAGDLNQGDLDAVMSTERALHQIAKPTIDLADGRRTIVFTTSVDNAHRMAEVFCRYKPESARAVDGGMGSEERRKVLADHRAGRYQFLINVAVLTEGYDDPAVACIAMGRPTKSRALYAQMAGRGTRLATGKDDLLLLDFVGNAGKHSLVSAIDILSGKHDDEVVAKAKELVNAEPGKDARKALSEAEAIIAAEREARAKKEEAARRAKVRAKVGYRAQVIDPFKVLGVPDPNQEWGAGRFGDAPASEAQLARMQTWKMDIPEGLTKRQAMRLIGQEHDRRAHGWCTYGQARTLQRYGYETKGIKNAQASRLMDALARNSWKPLPLEVAADLLTRQAGED